MMLSVNATRASDMATYVPYDEDSRDIVRRMVWEAVDAASKVAIEFEDEATVITLYREDQ
jgi:hypothetical protein